MSDLTVIAIQKKEKWNHTILDLEGNIKII